MDERWLLVKKSSPKLLKSVIASLVGRDSILNALSVASSGFGITHQKRHPREMESRS
jgi:hypothetical protein